MPFGCRIRIPSILFGQWRVSHHWAPFDWVELQSACLTIVSSFERFISPCLFSFSTSNRGFLVPRLVLTHFNMLWDSRNPIGRYAPEDTVSIGKIPPLAFLPFDITRLANENFPFSCLFPPPCYHGKLIWIKYSESNMFNGFFFYPIFF